ncbi:MAG: cytidine deaminase [Marinicella pacifica]
MPDIQKLLSAAKQAMQQAYAPYSKFKVGAALSDNAGLIHLGCNVENSAYPIGCCAEQAAVAAMILAQGQSIQDIVIVSAQKNPCPPCGACRQIIAEHSQYNTGIYLLNEDNSLIRYSVEDLLPQAFSPRHLDGG